MGGDFDSLKRFAEVADEALFHESGIDGRPDGGFTSKEFAEYRGISSRTALSKLLEFKKAGLLESLGRVTIISPLTDAKTVTQMYRFTMKEKKKRGGKEAR
jgi:hypothetical protein